MKILVISDSHGHIVNLKHVMGFAKKMHAGAVIHCGDWDDPESVKTVLSFGIPLYSVLGNADIEPEIEDLLKFQSKKFATELLSLEFEGRKVAIIHKVKADDKRLSEYKIVFSGHYHSKEEKTINWTKFIRPGAIINGINFAVFETVTGDIEFFEDKDNI